MIIKIICFLILLIQFSFFLSFAKAEIKVQNLHSKINFIDYKISTYKPKECNNENPCDVIYLLDSDYSFPIVKAIAEHLSERNHVKPNIIVGIGYKNNPGVDRINYQINRSRDYTPVPCNKKQCPILKDENLENNTGKAYIFIKVLQNEIIPNIEKQNNVTKNRTIVGHSFGGLFVIYSAIKSDIFNQYIAISPSFWYSDRFIFNQDLQKLQNKKIYITAGEFENKSMKLLDSVNDFCKILAQNKNIKCQILPQENHDTIFPSAFTKGLFFINDEIIA